MTKITLDNGTTCTISFIVDWVSTLNFCSYIPFEPWWALSLQVIYYHWFYLINDTPIFLFIFAIFSKIFCKFLWKGPVLVILKEVCHDCIQQQGNLPFNLRVCERLLWGLTGYPGIFKSDPKLFKNDCKCWKFVFHMTIRNKDWMWTENLLSDLTTKIWSESRFYGHMQIFWEWWAFHVVW